MDLVSTGLDSTGKGRRQGVLGRAVAMALIASGAVAVSSAGAQDKPETGVAESALLPFCTAGIADGKSLDAALGLYEVGDGLLSADLVASEAAAKCLKATSANLTLSVGEVQLNLVGSVKYDQMTGPQRRLIASTVDPVLCESYYPTSNSFALLLSNASNDLLGPGGLLRGVTSLSYSTATGAFNPQLAQATHGPYVSCFAATTANVPLNDAPAERIFSARFESVADLRVEYLDAQGQHIDSMNQLIDGNSSYKVRVSNQGEVAAANVRVREFVPKPAGQLTPNMTAVNCVRDGDNQSCAAADGTLQDNIASLAAGASRTYTLVRKVNGAAPIPAASGALTSVAAFVDPTAVSELNPADNSRRLRIGLVNNGVPIATAQTLTTAEDQPLVITLAGADPENSALTFQASNPTSGILSGTAPNLIYTPQADFNGSASFTYTVNDGSASSAPATVSITITAVNDAPRVVTQLPDITLSEGTTVDIPFAATFADPEGTALTYSVTGLPVGIGFSANNGFIFGTLGLTSAGVYNVQVTATENAPTALSVMQQFVLTVSNSNQAPTLVTPLADRNDNEGAVVSVNLSTNFDDADSNDTLTFSLGAGNLPAGLTLNPTTGVVSGSISQTAAAGSPYSVTITADDGNGGSVSDTFQWTVNSVNATPEAVGVIADRSAVVNVFLEISANEITSKFSDPDADALTYSATNLPPGLVISPSVGNILGQPTAAGQYAVEIKATDPNGLFAVQTFTFTITQ